MTNPEFLIGWDQLVDAFREPYGPDKKSNGRLLKISYDKIKRFDQNVWISAVDRILQDYEGNKFPGLKTILAYIYDAAEANKKTEDPPEVIEMKRIDREISKMPEADRKLLFTVARERTETEINSIVGEDAGFLTEKNSVRTQPEFFLSLPEIHAALYRIHCRQVYREMDETEYGKTGSTF